MRVMVHASPSQSRKDKPPYFFSFASSSASDSKAAAQLSALSLHPSALSRFLTVAQSTPATNLFAHFKASSPKWSQRAAAFFSSASRLPRSTASLAVAA